ncbi:sensor histidine kinase [Flammeovirga aprica]|uniref:Histidine kinase n=1 Tax=Flammeovirga aprica JL-4 TaxID=694437 RepID=A0A7X9RU53_9BACT|nr:histidine kinase [Flammeovirga aprica]NME68612.1 histidine kinase [Flammeovirga aprica JL-4]
MIVLEKNLKWVTPILSPLLSLLLLYFTYWSIIGDTEEINAFSYVSTYLYLIWFNGMVYFSGHLSNFYENFIPIRKNPSLRLTLELITLFVMALLFFYVVLITINLHSNKPSPHIIQKNNLILGVIQSLILLLYCSLIITDDYLRKWRDESIKAETLKQDKLRAENRALQAHLNPHFLFNSLNVLISEIEYDPVQAKKFAMDLSHTYRYVLQIKEATEVTFETEWEAMKHYLDLHQVRLGEGLNLDLNIENEKSQRIIPPLSLQLLLENVFKHNVATIRKPLTIKVEMREDFIKIENNIQLKNKKQESYNIGLTYLKESFKAMDKNAQVEITETSDYFSVTIPLLNKTA